MRWFSFVALLALAAILLVSNGRISSAQGTPAEPFHEKQPLATGYAVLSVDKPTIKLGERFAVNIRFYNTSSGEYFFNPFFQRLIPKPAQLAIYDSNKQYVADLLTWQGGSRRSVTAGDWTFIPTDCYVGTKLTFTAGYNPASSSRKLPAGDYYLQMIYFKAFTMAPRPSDDKPVPGEFYQQFSRATLFRSNAVKIHFTK